MYFVKDLEHINRISIPHGTIKSSMSLWKRCDDYISIPHGTIKREFLSGIITLNDISIPHGTIKRGG